MSVESPSTAERGFSSRPVFITFIAFVLCLSSIFQLSFATEMMRHARRIVEASSAEPPIAVRLLFPIWSRAARLPWEIALSVFYAVVTTWSIRRNRSRSVSRLVLLWILISTIFFAGLWVASLPYRSCCL
jgi:hypothetical protein